MGNNITELVFILDRSGSMTGLESNAPIRAMRQNRQVSDDWGKGIEEDFQNRKLSHLTYTTFPKELPLWTEIPL